MGAIYAVLCKRLPSEMSKKRRFLSEHKRLVLSLYRHSALLFLRE